MKLLIIAVVALIVWSEGRPLCEFSSCHECVKNPSCLWYQAKNGEYCSHSRVARSSYTMKIRSVSHCTGDASSRTEAPIPTTPLPVTTTTTSEVGAFSTQPPTTKVTFPTKKLVMQPEGCIKTSVSSRPGSSGQDMDNGKEFHLPSATPQVPLSTKTTEVSADKGSEYQLDEKTLKREINSLQCKEYAVIKRLRKLQRGKPLTNNQIKRIVKNCIKSLH